MFLIELNVFECGGKMFRATESSTNLGAKDFLYLKIQGLMAYIWGDGF